MGVLGYREIRAKRIFPFQRIRTRIPTFRGAIVRALFYVHMTMHMTPFRSLPADPAWGAGCVASVRSLPMRDRARAMRPARYVGPAGKERF